MFIYEFLHTHIFNLYMHTHTNQLQINICDDVIIYIKNA